MPGNTRRAPQDPHPPSDPSMLPSPPFQHILARSMDGILSSRSCQTLQVRVVLGESGCTPTWSTLLQRGCTMTPPGSSWGFIQMTVPPVPLGMWHHSMRWHHTGLFKSSQLWILGSGSGSATEGGYTHWQKWILLPSCIGGAQGQPKGWAEAGNSQDAAQHTPWLQGPAAHPVPQSAARAN